MKKINIVGAGIVGLSAAYELLKRDPSIQLTVLEKEKEICLHQTGRNSGVIHSGIYYASGSEKSKGCKEGIALLTNFCIENGIEIRRVGKLIVALREDEFRELERLYQNGIFQGIPGIEMLDENIIKEIEPSITGLKAIHLPSVSIVDYKEVGEVLKNKIRDLSGKILFNEKVVALRKEQNRLNVITEKSNYQCDLLINCAGLYSDKICSLIEGYVPVRIIPFRGEYFELTSDIADKINSLVYPVPNPLFPFLGIHLTPTMDKRVTAGPNAVLAFAREGYSWREFNLQEFSSTVFYQGFWKMAYKHFDTGMYEMARSLSKKLFLKSIKQFLPDIREENLLPYKSGVRAQAVDSNGKLVSDFVHLESKRAIHILNAPSPAATASFYIAQKIAELVEKRLL